MQRNIKKIKVCLVCPKAYPVFNPAVNSVFGGAEVDVYMIATELAKNDRFEVSCITADYGQPSEQIIENVQIIKSLDFRQNFLISVFKIWKALKKVDADIYLIKTASPGVPLTAVFCKFHRKIFAYRTAHRQECDGSWVKSNFILGRAFARSLRSARIVFSQNADDANLLKESLKIDSIVIPNGHRSITDLHYPKEYVLWVGRSADFKKPFKFIDLAKEFPNENFLMICQQATDSVNYDELISKAAKLANMTFVKSIPFADIDDYFARAKVLVNTSDAEGFPNTFIQAGKTSTPILSLNVNPDGFLQMFNCGLFADGDTGKLEQFLNILIKDKSNQMGKNAKNHFLQKHDITVVIDGYVKVFSQLFPETES